MKRILFLFPAFVILLSNFLPQAGYAQMIADPTEWTYAVTKKGAGEYELVFRVTLKEGWHIFSQNTGDEFLIPPSFSFAKGSGVKLIGTIKEIGKLKTEKMEGIDNPINYYEGKADFIQLVKARPGSKITGEHEYQVCNDRMCLPPKSRKFEFVIGD